MSRMFITGVLTLVVLSILTGCGGMDYGPDSPGYPQYRQLTLILAVQDPDGQPIANARVYVDGERDEWTTEDTFERLGPGFPHAWQDLLANWSSDFYQLIEDTPSDHVRFDLAVRKVGWGEDVSIVEIDDPTADHVFVRDVMTLYPGGSGTSPEPHYAEVIYASATPAAAPVKNRLVIRAGKR